MRASVLFVLGLILLAVPACRSGLSPSSGGKTRVWSLVRLDLDRSVVANAGRMPIFPPVSGSDFGLVPQAMGTLQITDQGNANCIVRIREPVLGVGGTPLANDYDVLSFFGALSDDGRRIERRDLVPASTPLGVATVLHLEEMSDEEVKVRAYTGDRLLPYVFTFAGPPARAQRVTVPTYP